MIDRRALLQASVPFLAALAWMVFVFVETTAPVGTRVPGSGSGIFFDRFDLFAHAGALGLVAGLLALSVLALRLSAYARALRTAMPVIVATAYGGVIEFVQRTIDGRAGSWSDLAADFGGALLAVVALDALLALQRRWRARVA